jgi:tRNA A37 threonylcarbamoyladenosine modification protein TsaB
MILAIDTCLAASSIAVLDGDTVRAARSEPMTRATRNASPSWPARSRPRRA